MKDVEQAYECEADASLISAMNHHQLKEEDQARAALDQGHEIVRTRLPALESKHLGGSWMNVLMTSTLMSEADKTVGIVFQSQAQESPASTGNKAPTDVTTGTVVDVSKMPQSHQMGSGDR